MQKQFVILTWDSIHDIDVIRDDRGSAATFKSIKKAEEWIDDNDGKCCLFTKIIELEE